MLSMKKLIWNHYSDFFYLSGTIKSRVQARANRVEWVAECLKGARKIGGMDGKREEKKEKREKKMGESKKERKGRVSHGRWGPTLYFGTGPIPYIHLTLCSDVTRKRSERT